MSRSKLFLKNTIWELGYYILVVLLGFMAPRYIILTYGSEVNGLSSTITQILNVILLLQAGATTAAVYSLYQPIADNDIDKVSERLASSTSYFKKLSYVFLSIMMVMAIVTALTIKSSMPESHIFVAFIAMGLKSFFDLYSTSKYRVVFSAYQEKFIISIATLIEQVIYYVLVFATIYLSLHYLFLFFWLFTGCIVKILILRTVYVKKHCDIKPVNAVSSEGIKGKNYSLANEVAHSIITTSIAILISFLYGLEETSVYSIYALVFSALYLVSSALNSSFGPSFANLWANGDGKRAREVFVIFQFLYIAMNTVFMMCSLYLIVPFVEIYIGSANDIVYANKLLAVLFCIQGLLSAYRIPYNLIVSSCGYFKETWLQPVVTLIVSLAISLGLGCIDYSYILLGPAFFYMVNFIYQHFKLKMLCPVLISNRVFISVFISLVGLLLMGVASFVYPVSSRLSVWLVATVVTLAVVVTYIIMMSRWLLAREYSLSKDYFRSLLKKIKDA